MENEVQRQSVTRDGEPFEYDAVIPAGELRPLVLKHIIVAACAQETGLSHDLYIKLIDGQWIFHGTNGRVGGLSDQEPVYVRFIDIVAMENDLAIKRRDVHEAIQKYG